MGDTTSACIFHTIFKRLASDPTEQHKKWALEFWAEAHAYDFAWIELECAEAMAKLGLARMRVDPDFPDDGEVWFFGPEGKDEP